jgi:hypothetical protein
MLGNIFGAEKFLCQCDGAISRLFAVKRVVGYSGLCVESCCRLLISRYGDGIVHIFHINRRDGLSSVFKLDIS